MTSLAQLDSTFLIFTETRSNYLKFPMVCEVIDFEVSQKKNRKLLLSNNIYNLQSKMLKNIIFANYHKLFYFFLIDWYSTHYNEILVIYLEHHL